ncbi:MAG: OB-fold domain-containing protein, partial [Candidatus Binatia bacterium]
MIARLAGRLHRKSPEHLVVDVGGVGYQVLVSLQTYARLPGEGEQVELDIYTHVREDTLA